VGEACVVIRVAALTSGENVPSSRFRVRQFIEPLLEWGVEVAESHLSYSKYLGGSRAGGLGRGARKLLGRIPGVLQTRTADVTWLERELIPGRVTLEGLTKRPRLLDVDDALWLNGASGFSERIARLCDGVIAGNEFLAEHYRSRGSRTWVVPTAVDTDRFCAGASHPTRPWTVGWTGTASTLPFLLAIEGAVAEFLRSRPEARLLVMCDERPAFRHVPDGRWSFFPWSAAHEADALREMDAGLMPLPDTDWARGKCAFKLLLYFATGMPAVASPVGMNAEVLGMAEAGHAARTPREWVDALSALYDDRACAAALGAAGRRLVEEHFSVAVVAPRLAAIFREVAA
jgi:glycosyltransferase involved in cell wall biosynthesis